MSKIGYPPTKKNIFNHLSNRQFTSVNKTIQMRSYSSNYKQRATSGKPNQFPDIYKKYQQFCDKYFHSNQSLFVTPIIHRNKREQEHRQNGLQFAPKIQKPFVEGKNVNLKFLDNENYDFSLNINCHKELFKQIVFTSNTQSLGLEKNNKGDYNQRYKTLHCSQSNNNKDNKNYIKSNKDNENDDYNDDEFNIQNEDNDSLNKNNNSNIINELNNDANSNIINELNNDANGNDDNDHDKQNAVIQQNNIQIFDESTHKIINNEMRNQAATKIQIYFKQQQHRKRKRDQIFLGYDKSKQYILFVYIDKNTIGINSEIDIWSLFFKIYSIEKKTTFIKRKDIKELLFDNSISNKQISQVLPNIVDKIIEEDVCKCKEKEKGNVKLKQKGIRKGDDEEEDEDEEDEYGFDSNYSLDLDSRQYSDS